MKQGQKSIEKKDLELMLIELKEKRMSDKLVLTEKTRNSIIESIRARS